MIARVISSLRRRRHARTLARAYRPIEHAYLSVTGCADPAAATGTAVIFSFDRAAQLEALLRSYAAQVTNPVPLTVLYRATSDRHARAYDQVLASFAPLGVSAVRQHTRDDFRPLLVGILDKLLCAKVLFLVDDIAFIHRVDLAPLLAFDTRDFVPSLRLGENLTRCYTFNASQPLPAFTANIGPYRTWTWDSGKFDWAYPLSVDGHVFGVNEFRSLVRATEFVSPNSFEHGLQQFHRFFAGRRGVCHPVSRIVNVPWNKVQSENQNLHGGLHQDDLLAKWEEGFRIHIEAFYGIVTESCHQELPVAFVPRSSSESPAA